MYFGELSYNHNNDLNEFIQIIRTTYKYNDDMSPELKDLLDKMIEINPMQRANIDECLAHNWLHKNDAEILKEEEKREKDKNEDIKKIEFNEIK